MGFRIVVNLKHHHFNEGETLDIDIGDIVISSGYIFNLFHSTIDEKMITHFK